MEGQYCTVKEPREFTEKIKKWNNETDASGSEMGADIEKLVNNDAYLYDRLKALTPVIMEKTLKAGETTVSFTVPGLKDTSRVEPISRQWGISPVSVYDEGETVTMAFDARTEDVIVGVEVRL